MATIFLVLGAVVIALVVSTLARRHASPAETEADHHIPDHLDGTDFNNPDGRRMLVVFSSNKCDTCAVVVESAMKLDFPWLMVDVVDIETREGLHNKYGIDAVPVTLLAETSGHVVKSFLGPAGLALMKQAIADAWPDTASGNLGEFDRLT